FAQEPDDGPGDTRRHRRRFASSRAPCDLMTWEAAAKLVAGLVGLTSRLTRHTMKAKSVFGFAHATCGSPPFTSDRCSRRPVGDVRVSHSETATGTAGKDRRG